MSPQGAHRILVVDDEPVARTLTERSLSNHGYVVASEDGALPALARLRREPFDLVMSDLKMPEHDGLYLLERVRERHPGVVVIIMTGHGSIETAVEAMRQGAYDYVVKPLRPEEIVHCVGRALEHRHLSNEVTALRRELRDKYSVENMVGASAAMQAVHRFIGVVSATDGTVLIQSETGTGKELLARAIHYQSPRRERRFVKVNCSVLSETLIESELFGHEKGAFTGAVATKHGLFHAAHHGALFLDEIGELPASPQSKLLQVIEHGVFRRIGSTEEQAVDVRIIAATNRDLTAEVEQGRFRADLYHRVSVLTIDLPPLRERLDDIPLLVHHFLRRYRKGDEGSGVAPEVMEAFARYRWPGNVRELQNVIERAVTFAGDRQIVLADLPDHFSSPLAAAPEPAGRGNAPPPRSLEEVERDYVADVLRATAGNKTRAAQILGVTRVTLRKKIAKYGLTAD